MKKKKEDLVTVCLFLSILFVLFAAGLLKKDKGFSEYENRYLAKRPELSAQNLLSGRYMMDYETYITDQFPMRNQWISIKTLTERALLKQEVNGVYFGEDDYFIEHHNKEDFQTEQSVKNQGYLEQFIRKYQPVFGEASLKVMLVPTASYVLEQKLPLLAPYDGQKEFLEALAAKTAKDCWVDAASVLAEKREEEIYYRTDHHWTTLGAYYGYQTWAMDTGREPEPLSGFAWKALTENFYGTLYAKVNIKMKPDTIYAFEPAKPVAYTMRLNREEQLYDSLYDMEKLNTRDKYAVFCHGNNPLTEIRTEVGNGEKLLILKDSFANNLTPFFIPHFEEIYMIDLRYYNGSIEDFLEENGITDLLVLYNTANFASDRHLNKLVK